MEKKILKNFLVFEIISSKDVAVNCPYKEENTCHWQSMC